MLALFSSIHFSKHFVLMDDEFLWASVLNAWLDWRRRVGLTAEPESGSFTLKIVIGRWLLKDKLCFECGLVYVCFAKTVASQLWCWYPFLHHITVITLSLPISPSAPWHLSRFQLWRFFSTVQPLRSLYHCTFKGFCQGCLWTRSLACWPHIWWRWREIDWLIGTELQI